MLCIHTGANFHLPRWVPSKYTPVSSLYRENWHVMRQWCANCTSPIKLKTNALYPRDQFEINPKDAQGIANIYNAHAQFKFPTPGQKLCT